MSTDGALDNNHSFPGRVTPGTNVIHDAEWLAGSPKSHHVPWQPTRDRDARYYDGPVIKKSWLFIARAPKAHPKCEASVGIQPPPDERVMESMLDPMQTMDSNVDNMHRWGASYGVAL